MSAALLGAEIARILRCQEGCATFNPFDGAGDFRGATVGLATGGKPYTGSARNPVRTPTLAEAGIGKHLAHEGRKLGALSEQAFERAIKTARESVGRVVKQALQNDDKKGRRADRERELGNKIAALPEGKFGVVVEDFEWDHETWSEAGKDRHAGNHYPTSRDAHTAEEIVERTRERFLCAADDCILFMWTTAPHLAVAIDVLRLRGFTYKSNDVWIKHKLGTGYWNQNQHETLLIGTRGKPIALATGADWGSSVIVAPSGKHSAKPELVLEVIEELWPTTPKIELNRRGPARPGWEAWGNEMEEPALDQDNRIVTHEELRRASRAAAG